MPDFDFNPTSTPSFETPVSRSFAEAEPEDDVEDADVEETDLEETDLEEPPARARGGLPPSFRMRHAPHYVEQLMGEAPLQTVRQIPLSNIHGAHIGGDRVRELATSIREIGLLEPLLVTRRSDAAYDVLSGERRLCAAREAGLETVPCLVVDADDAMAAKFREAALRTPELVPARTEREEAPASEAAPGDSVAPDAPDALRSAFVEISESLTFVNALMPLSGGRSDALRTRVVADLMRIETERATALASAATLMMRTEPLRSEVVDCAAHMAAVRAAISIAARYKGVDVEWHDSLTAARKVADREALATAWSALLHGMLTLAQPGERLIVTAQAPRVRPALMLDLLLRGASAVADAADRLTDTTWAQHPGGLSCAVMFCAAARSAQMHRGRLSLRKAEEGLSVSFVVPQPLWD